MIKYSQFYDHGDDDVSFELSLNERFESKESWPTGPGFVLSSEGICFVGSSLTY
jgi:hypothetical protein